MQKFSKFIINNNKLVITIIILITLVLGFFLKNIQINADVLSYLPKSDPVAEAFNYIGEEYGGNSLAIVAIETDDIFNVNTIKNINTLTTKFKNLEGVNYVTSLTNVLDIKKMDDGLEIGRLVDEYKLPETKNDLEKLKIYTLSKDMYRGKLISEDGKATVIICRLNTDIDKIETVRKIKTMTIKEKLKEKIYYGGIPFQMDEVSGMIVDDLIFLLPLLFLLISISLFFSFQSIRGVLIPIISVFISIIWTLGIMSLLKIPVTMISNIIPIILIAVGSAYSIHVISKFNESDSGNNDIAIRSIASLREVGIPVILAALTTVAGFLAFVFGAYLTMIQEFGIFSAMGVFFALIISITFVPAILSLLQKKDGNNSKIEKVQKKSSFELFMDKMGDWIIANPKLIIMGGAIIVIIALFAMPYIERKVDMLDYFKAGSDIRKAEKFMERNFGGSIPVQILVKGDIQDPSVLSEMKKLQNFLETLGNVYNPQSVADLIEEMNDVMGEGKLIPKSRGKINNLWFLIEGEEVMSQLVNSDKSEALIQATMMSMKTDEIITLVTKVNDYIKKIDNKDISFVLSGIPSIYKNLDDSIVQSQMQSMVFAIILVFFSLTIMLRSFLGGLIGLIPILFTLIILFGIMGIFGIPLDVATVLVGSISIGIGIDYSIHFINRFKFEFKKDSSLIEALDRTLETTGKAIIINVITVTLGFVMLLFASVVPIQRFGILIAITMVGSGIGAITLLPATIIITKAGFIGDWDRFSNKIKGSLKNRIQNNKS
jgi:uncharacterized protein